MLSQVNQIKALMKDNEFDPRDFIAQIAVFTCSRAYLIGLDGNIVVSSVTEKALTLMNNFKQSLRTIQDEVFNIAFELNFIKEEAAVSQQQKREYLVILPLRKHGYLVLAKPEKKFTEDELTLAIIMSLQFRAAF